MNAPDLTAQHHQKLDTQREVRLARWTDLEHELRSDAGNPPSTAEWADAREKFYERAGPIPVSRADRDVLASLKDRYKGERIFVLGNGPSLNDTPLHLLRDEYTFCVNRIYLLFDRIRWRPTFYTTVDWRVSADCADEINLLDGMHFFFPERFRGVLRDGDDVTWYWNGPSPDRTQRRFATDASLGVRGAGSVVGAAIQLAFHMGFDPIYLLGCDVSYRIPDTVLQEGPDKFGTGVGLYLTSTRDDDDNHFDSRYFGRGRRWHDPNVQRMIEGFEQCKEGADAAGRRILNATVGGQLEVFERVAIRSLFRRKRPSTRTPTVPESTDGVSGSPARLSVPEEASVPPGLLVKGLLGLESPGLVVDIGAGSGLGSAPFAASGWEVRAFEPEPAAYDRLLAILPPRWPVFVDPRALGGVEADAPIYPCPTGGGSLVPRTPSAEALATVRVVTPEVGLSPLRGRTPDVVLVSASGWEREILRAYPFDEARPTAVVVDVDDGYTQRFGYRGTDVAKQLGCRGYEVFAVEHRRVTATLAMQAICTVEDHAGNLTHLMALPPGLTSIEALDTYRRAVLDAREEMSARAKLHERPSESRSRPKKRASKKSTPSKKRSSPHVQVSPPGTTSPLRTTAEIQAELDALRGSTSWRIGHGIVVTARRLSTSVLHVAGGAGRVRRAGVANRSVRS